MRAIASLHSAMRAPATAGERRVRPDRVQDGAAPRAGPEVGPLADRCPNGITEPLPFSGVRVQVRKDVALARLRDVVSERVRPFAVAPLDATLLVEEYEHHRNVVDDPL